MLRVTIYSVAPLWMRIALLSIYRQIIGEAEKLLICGARLKAAHYHIQRLFLRGCLRDSRIFCRIAHRQYHHRFFMGRAGAHLI